MKKICEIRITLKFEPDSRISSLYWQGEPPTGMPSSTSPSSDRSCRILEHMVIINPNKDTFFKDKTAMTYKLRISIILPRGVVVHHEDPHYMKWTDPFPLIISLK